MSDVFISYAREDRPWAQQLAHALEATGLSIWWDREIPTGRSFDEVIDEQLRDANAVIVVWSASSVTSRWVKEEAGEAADRGCVFPVMKESVRPPLGFRRLQASDLTDWDGVSPEHRELAKLIADLRQQSGGEHLGTRPEAKSGGSHRLAYRGEASRDLLALGLCTALVAVGLFVLRQGSTAGPTPGPIGAGIMGVGLAVGCRLSALEPWFRRTLIAVAASGFVYVVLWLALWLAPKGDDVRDPTKLAVLLAIGVGITFALRVRQRQIWVSRLIVIGALPLISVMGGLFFGSFVSWVNTLAILTPALLVGSDHLVAAEFLRPER